MELEEILEARTLLDEDRPNEKTGGWIDISFRSLEPEHDQVSERERATMAKSARMKD